MRRAVRLSQMCRKAWRTKRWTATGRHMVVVMEKGVCEQIVVLKKKKNLERNVWVEGI